MQLTLALTDERQREAEVLRQRADALWQLRLTSGTARWQVFQDCRRRLLELGYLYGYTGRYYGPMSDEFEEDTELWTTPDTYVPSRTGHQGAEPPPAYPEAFLAAVQRQSGRR